MRGCSMTDSYLFAASWMRFTGSQMQNTSPRMTISFVLVYERRAFKSITCLQIVSICLTFTCIMHVNSSFLRSCHWFPKRGLGHLRRRRFTNTGGCRILHSRHLLEHPTDLTLRSATPGFPSSRTSPPSSSSHPSPASTSSSRKTRA
jgi:hypothetical protein